MCAGVITMAHVNGALDVRLGELGQRASIDKEKRAEEAKVAHRAVVHGLRVPAH